jgi:branched-chain amino acid transport system substrate-binding protein
MVRRFVRTMVAAAIVLGAATLAACGDDSGGSEAGASAQGNGEPIVVAEIVDLTGSLQSFNEVANPGYDYGIEDINAAGGINGSQIEVRKLDTGTETPQAPLLVRKAAQEGAVVVLGPYSSNMAVASAPVAAQQRVPMLLPTSIADWPEEFNDFTFRVTPPLDVVIPEYIPQVLEQIDAQSMGIIYDKANEASVTAFQQVERAIPAAGATLTGVEAYQTGDVDFTAQVSKILAGEPDAIFLAAISTEAALLMRQLRQRGFEGRFVSESTLNNPDLLEQSGGAAEGLITYQVFNPEAEDSVTQSIRERYGKSLPGTIGQTYATTQVLVDALKRAEDPHDPESVREALSQTADVQTVIGPVTWEGKGNNLNASFTTLELTEKGFAPFEG